MPRFLALFNLFIGVTVAFAQPEQEISFTLTDHNLEEETFTLEATSSSELPVVFTTDSDRITIDGTTATILKAGKVTITASQEGNDLFNPATKDATICINPPKPLLVFVTIVRGGFLGSIANHTEGDIQWFLNNEPIPGSTGLSPIAEASGNYSAQVTVDGCTGPMSDVVPFTYSGIEDEIPGVSIYPNPARTFVYAESPSSASITITNSVGQALETRSFTGNIELPVSSYAQGFYVVKISVNNKVLVRKLIKE